MRKFLAIVLCGLFMMSLITSCGQKEEAGQQTETPAAGQPEELADTTRLDSAVVDSAVATPDSM